MNHRRAFVYDAVAILGFGPASAEPLPAAAPGEMVIRIGAWSLKNLFTNEIVVREKLMWNNDWHDRYLWSSTQLTPGVYRLRLPVPDSNQKTFSEQLELLLPGEVVAPAALTATALLVHFKETDKDLLSDNAARCAEALPGDDRAALAVLTDRVRVFRLWDGIIDRRVWLCSSRAF